MFANIFSGLYKILGTLYFSIKIPSLTESTSTFIKAEPLSVGCPFINDSTSEFPAYSHEPLSSFPESPEPKLSSVGEIKVLSQKLASSNIILCNADITTSPIATINSINSSNILPGIPVTPSSSDKFFNDKSPTVTPAPIFTTAKPPPVATVAAIVPSAPTAPRKILTKSQCKPCSALFAKT